MSQTVLTIRQWATYTRLVTLKDTNDDPIDLTGFEVLGQIRQKYKDVATAAEFTVTPNPDPTTGEVTISLTDDETGSLDKTSWTAATYYFDLVLREIATDVRERIVEGTVIVFPGVTHDAVS